MTVGFIGSGNMARALARGLGDPVLASDGGSGRAAALVAEVGGEALDNAGVAARADVLVLACKPYQLEQVAPALGEARTVVSLLGATPIDGVRAALPDAQVAKAMPNTPVEVRRGAQGGARPVIVATPRHDVASYVQTLVFVYTILIVAYILSSMFFQVGGRLPYSRAINAIMGFLRDVCEPFLRIFRRFLPPLGPLDLSPMVAIIVLNILGAIVANAING